VAKRKLYIGAALLVGLALLLYLTTPPALVNAATVPNLPADLESYLAEREKQVDSDFALVPGTEKRVVWREPGQRTEYAVIYLHGFSATRQETAPLAEQIAAALGANLFETRLTGHGHSERPMHGVQAEAWLQDAVEALSIGARIGDKLVVIGTSTGGTLALATAEHESAAAVTDLVLISPNLQPADRRSNWLTRPLGPLLAQLISGDTRSWTAHNEQQERYWSTSYPTTAVVEVMRLVDFVRNRLPMSVPQDLLVIVSPDDSVVSAEVTKQAFERIDAPKQSLVEFEQAQDPSRHVLAGDILSPDTTETLAATIVDFVTAP
jgi:esterase/lipase